MICFIFPRYSGSVFQLVVRGLLKADRKCLHRLGRLQSHGRDHQAGIDTAAEKRSQGYVRNHASAHSFIEELTQSLAGLLLSEPGSVLLGKRRKLPIAALLYRAIIRVLDPATWHQLANRPERAVRISDVSELKI